MYGKSEWDWFSSNQAAVAEVASLRACSCFVIKAFISSEILIKSSSFI